MIPIILILHPTANIRRIEEAQGRRNTVIVPASGFKDFAELIQDILSTEAAKTE